MKTAFGAQLKDRIERQYSAGGYSLGWRLLYSPEAVLEGARVAFLGLNPGGNHRPPDHAEFTMECGKHLRTGELGDIRQEQANSNIRCSHFLRGLVSRQKRFLQATSCPFDHRAGRLCPTGNAPSRSARPSGGTFLPKLIRNS